MVYEVIGSNKSNPWFVLGYVTGDDEWEAETAAIARYGMDGFRTVQLIAKAFFKRKRS